MSRFRVCVVVCLRASLFSARALSLEMSCYEQRVERGRDRPRGGGVAFAFLKGKTPGIFCCVGLFVCLFQQKNLYCQSSSPLIFPFLSVQDGNVRDRLETKDITHVKLKKVNPSKASDIDSCLQEATEADHAKMSMKRTGSEDNIDNKFRRYNLCDTRGSTL
jgi:hypothetical protein